MESARKIEVQNAAVEIRAIPGQQVEAGAVFPGIHAGDQCVVLLFSGGKAESVDAPVIGHAHKLTPPSFHVAAPGHVFPQAQQMSFMVLVAQGGDSFADPRAAGTSAAFSTA